MKDYWVPLSGAVGVLVVIALTALAVAFTPDWWNEKAGTTVQAGVLVALAIITAIYSFHTHDLAKQARTQAAAMSASVAEVEKQRKLSTQPWVFPDLQSGQVISGADILLKNFGHGPALSLRGYIFRA